MEIPTSPTNYSPPPGPPDCDPPTPWEAECEIMAVLNAIRTVSENEIGHTITELHSRNPDQVFTWTAQYFWVKLTWRLCNQDSGRIKRSQGTETEPCYLLPPGVAFWPRFEGIRADRATDTEANNEDVVTSCEAAVDMEVDGAVEAGGGSLYEDVVKNPNDAAVVVRDSEITEDDVGLQSVE